MTRNESASYPGREAIGWFLGSVGVIAFSMTLPATRAAEGAFSALTVGVGRAVVAGLLALIVLAARREPLVPPYRRAEFAAVAVGVVFGFPILTSFALESVSASHGAVVTGLLPVATAGMAVWRAGERPGRQYWLALGVGVFAVLAFAVTRGAGALRLADLALLGAVLLGGLGYAEGGALAREYGGWRVICWALVLSLPITLPVTAIAVAIQPPSRPSAGALSGLAYVSCISMFVAFFAWYGGMARVGVARIARLQLAQPVLTLAWSVALLGEHVTAATAVAAAAVLLSVGAGRRAVVGQAQRQPAGMPTNPAVSGLT